MVSWQELYNDLVDMRKKTEINDPQDMEIPKNSMFTDRGFSISAVK